MSASLPPHTPIDEDAWDASTQEALRDLYEATQASPSDLARLQARIRSSPSAAPRWPIAFAVGLLLAGVGIGFWALDNASPREARIDAGVLTVDGEQIAVANGQGEVTLDGERVRLDWVVGTLEVDAAAADRLWVLTPELDWVVAGKGSIARDRLGTHLLDAAAGTCRGLRDGDTCLPVQASGWLGRAHALAGDGDWSASGAAFEEARDLAGDQPAVRAEAWAGLADALVRSGDVQQAALVAEQALADGAGTREEQLHVLAARAYLTIGDCGSALPHLQALPDPSADEAEHAARCVAQLRSSP